MIYAWGFSPTGRSNLLYSKSFGIVGMYHLVLKNFYLLILIRVMDKPHQHAVICSHPKVYRERVLDGWHTVAAFRNGEEVKI